jgi:NAD(P)-dependent dehydrogenase (short-subunit alcohol dehydrogenase family)
MEDSMNSRKKRVVILADAQTHMMPALAMEMARRNHDLVLGDAKDGLADELTKLGVKVELVPDTADQTKPDTIQKLVDRAKDAFGGFDSACIRTGVHGTGNLLDSTAEDCDIQYAGNFRSVFYALKALLPPLIEQKSGQVVINTSAAGARVQNWFALYGATRAGANALIKAAGLEAAPHGVTVNGTGTYAMDYPSFLHDVGADKGQGPGQAQGGRGSAADAEALPAQGGRTFCGDPDRRRGDVPDGPVLPHRRWLELHVSRGHLALNQLNRRA